MSLQFDIIRLIYKQEYDKINMVYKNKAVDTELALVIGSITQSARIINEALIKEGEGKQMEMCKALQALEQRGMEAGQKAGVETGKKEHLKQQIQKKLVKGKSIEMIADELEEDVSAIQPIIDEIRSEK